MERIKRAPRNVDTLNSWKTEKDISLDDILRPRVSFSTNSEGNPILLGGNTRRHTGVYVGRVHFKDGSINRVAIKRFGLLRNDEYAAQKTNEVIKHLVEAGVSLPKMRMIKLPKGTPFGKEQLVDDEWVLVSQLFGSTQKGSKLHPKSWVLLSDKESRKEAVAELTKVTNAGYPPADDIIEPLMGKQGVVPFDLDEIFMEERRNMADLTEVRKLANELLIDIALVARDHPEDIRTLLSIARRTASPKLGEILGATVGDISTQDDTTGRMILGLWGENANPIVSNAVNQMIRSLKGNM